ncbi:MAG TPA: carboxypeptidase-like regulatory domain-containing protein [Gemmatimonadaceae bacterium]
MVTIVNPLCARRPDYATAFALWQQARAGLVSTIAAREANPADSKVLVYQRPHFQTSDRIAEQKVRIDSGRWTTPFVAAVSAAEFVQSGFVKEEGDGRRTYYGPDAELLVQEEFQARYCFSLASDKSRSSQVGLHFAPAARERSRVDIDGTLWIDTVARKLCDIEFRYLGLDLGSERLNPSGHIAFREASNGITFIDNWSLRIISFDVDTTHQPLVLNREPGSWDKLGPSRGRIYHITDGGGEVARAQWSDGTTWRASLGKLRVHTVDAERRPVSRVRVQLAATDYSAVSDSTGSLLIEDLFPGPYKVVIVDSTLAAIGVTMQTELEFVAARDSTFEGSILVSDAADVVADECRRTGRDSQGFMILGRVVSRDGKYVNGARWQILQSAGRTAADGTFLACMSGNWGTPLEIRVLRSVDELRGETLHVIPVTPSKRLTVVRVDLP